MFGWCSVAVCVRFVFGGGLSDCESKHVFMFECFFSLVYMLLFIYLCEVVFDKLSMFECFFLLHWIRFCSFIGVKLFLTSFPCLTVFFSLVYILLFIYWCEVVFEKLLIF